MTTVRPPFPSVIDSTMRAAFRSCPRKFQLTYTEHWKPRGDSVHLVAGKAFARGLEVARREFYERNQPADVAVARGLVALLTEYGTYEFPPGSAKTPERTAGALEYYFSVWPLESDPAKPRELSQGNRAIEFSFAEPLGVLHPETGDPILYCGRADMVADFAGGIWVEDDKTTSALGTSWLQQWDLRSQFTGYVWAARRNHWDVQGVLVRGIAILKTLYNHAEVPTGRAKWEVLRWEEQLRRDVTRMIACWEEGYWDYDLDHSCSEYGGCPYRQICKSPEPEAWLPMHFERRVWDPLARTETLVEPAE